VALDAARKGLEGASAHWERVLEIASFIVLAGVVAELIEVFFEVRESVSKKE
jgi:ABC-type microcin C transport system permease subunit YejB